MHTPIYYDSEHQSWYIIQLTREGPPALVPWSLDCCGKAWEYYSQTLYHYSQSVDAADRWRGSRDPQMQNL